MRTIRKIIVLGGHGFVGGHVTDRLRRDGHEVLPLSRRDGFDLRDPGATHALLAEQRPDAVFHLAANTGSLHYVTEHIADVIHDNVQMALNLYAAVAESCSAAIVVNALANCSYPGDTDRYVENDWWRGEVHESVYGYGNAQRFIYVLARGYRNQHGIRSKNFLVPNTFGPGDSTDPNRTHALNGMMIRMIRAKRRGAPEFEVWGTGRPVREWAWVGDVARILATGLALEEDLVVPVNIGQARGYSIADSAAMIARAIGYPGRLTFNPEYADGAPEKIMDDTRFRQVFPDYEFHDHEAGIRETIAFYEAALEKTE